MGLDTGSPREVKPEKVVKANGRGNLVNLTVEGKEYVRIERNKDAVEGFPYRVEITTEEGEPLIVVWGPESEEPYDFKI